MTATATMTATKWPVLQDFFDKAGVGDRFPVAEAMRMRRWEPATQEWVPLVPHPHQIRNLNQALTADNLRFGDYSEPGCGKTLTAQAFGIYHALLGNRCVVIMPPVLLRQFQVSMNDTFEGFSQHFSLHILREPPKERQELFKTWRKEGWPQFLCCSYQMYLKLFETLKEPYDVVICDEAHALKTPSSQIHKAVNFHLGEEEGERALLLMTGTPITNTLEDAYGMIKMIKPKLYFSKKSFERAHCDYVLDGGYRRLIGFRNIEILTQRLYTNARRVTKDQVFTLEKPIIQELAVELSKEHRALYKKLVNERYLEVRGKVIDAIQAQSLRMKCLRIVTCPHEFSEKKIPNAIVDTVKELFDSIDLGRDKVVLFGTFQDSIRYMGEVFKDLNPALVYGDSNTTKQVQKFLEDPSCRIMIAHPQSGGVGLNLQKVARYVIFFEPLSVPGWFKQAMERVYRLGQDHVVQVWILKALNTVAQGLTRAMLVKEGQVKLATLDSRSLLDDLMGEEEMKMK